MTKYRLRLSAVHKKTRKLVVIDFGTYAETRDQAIERIEQTYDLDGLERKDWGLLCMGARREVWVDGHTPGMFPVRRA